MNLFRNLALSTILFLNTAQASTTPHLILKNDFNSDGIADRVIFASYGASGFFQSTEANNKIDTVYLRQGNRTVFYTSSKELGGPFVKLSEEAGFFTVITLLKYENRRFKHITSYSLPNKTFFSDEGFDSLSVESDSKSDNCSDANAFNNKATDSALSWAEAIESYSTEETIKKAISPSCKSTFGADYDKMEKQIVAACNASDGKPETNSLVSCLDKNKETRRIGGRYKTTLAENIFDSGFKISCSKSENTKPSASFDSSSRNISFFKVTPPPKDRNFKFEFFHELMHDSGLTDEKDIEAITKGCFTKTQKIGQEGHFESSPLTLANQVEQKKNGVEVSISSAAKEVPQNSIAAAVSDGARTLDNNFSMDNISQYRDLSKTSKGVFGAFSNTFKRAYEAAVPAAFAQGTIESAPTTTTIPLSTSKLVGNNRTVASANSYKASGVVYDVSSLPESVGASAQGELGNGLTVKASAVAFNEVNSRGPAATGSSETATGGRSSGGRSIAGSLASIKTTDRPDLRNNVPQLKAEEEFLKSLTSGKYAEVKAKLTDPKNQKILEEKKIQYVARDKTLGSKQPAIILKDLGNKFTVLRVNVE